MPSLLFPELYRSMASDAPMTEVAAKWNGAVGYCLSGTTSLLRTELDFELSKTGFICRAQVISLDKRMVYFGEGPSKDEAKRRALIEAWNWLPVHPHTIPDSWVECSVNEGKTSYKVRFPDDKGLLSGWLTWGSKRYEAVRRAYCVILNHHMQEMSPVEDRQPIDGLLLTFKDERGVGDLRNRLFAWFDGLNEFDDVWLDPFLVAMMSPSIHDLYLSTRKKEGIIAFERDPDMLANLGDRLLGALVSKWIFVHGATSRAQMDQLVRALVCNENLARLYDELELDDFLLHTPGEYRTSVHHKGDRVEALFAAAVLVMSGKPTYKWVNRFLCRLFQVEQLQKEGNAVIIGGVEATEATQL